MKYLLCTGIVLLLAFPLQSQRGQIIDAVNAESAMETNASGILAKELKTLGFEVKEGIGIMGVVAILKNGTGPVVMYRADMDCYAVKETTGLPYASSANTTVMHSCGHDEHVNWIIGVAKKMIQSKDQWKGTLILVGEASEEQILVAEATANNDMYSNHSDPQPHHHVAINTTPASAGMAGANRITRMIRTLQKAAAITDGCNSPELEACHHLELHNAQKDYCYIEIGATDDYKVELAAIPLGVKTGTDALLEIFKWATASR